MAQPLLDFLTGRARQALPYLQGAARRGLSVSAAIDLLRPLNLTFNRQRMIDVYKLIQGNLDVTRILRTVPRTAPIPAELHNPSPVNLTSNYQYVVVATDVTGEPVGGVTVSSNVPLAAVQIEATAGLLFKDQAELYLEEDTLPPAAVSIEQINVSPTAIRP